MNQFLPVEVTGGDEGILVFFQNYFNLFNSIIEEQCNYYSETPPQ